MPEKLRQTCELCGDDKELPAKAVLSRRNPGTGKIFIREVWASTDHILSLKHATSARFAYGHAVPGE